MRLALVRASLFRHRVRTALAVLGVAVAAAMLLDMVMLAGGMQVSFRQLLVRQGFGMRLAPKGTLPFDSEARIARAAQAESTLRRIEGIEVISPVLGSTLHVLLARAPLPVFALGLDRRVQGDYEMLEGRDTDAPDRVVVNDDFLAHASVRIGDTLDVASGYDALLRSWTARRRLVVSGRARFFYLARDQRAMALPLATLQAMGGGATADRVSLFMLKLKDANTDSLRARIERALPRVTAIPTADAIRSVEQRLSYFRQLAFILGTVSLVVGFLLVSTLVTVSAQERLGEMAVMRAIGISRPHIALQVMLEGLAISVAGSSLGLGLGLLTARYLNAILRSFPGLPAAIDFFVFDRSDAIRSFGLLIATALLASVVPSWRASSLAIATTLREEAIA
jgi:putative ABC transport system permease protein